ncbi:hypothetical protein HY498_01985 [Candidatus Woesearchaeota archaeon]|nr:hypothetical protein [Candidatus Woesearchaeota archaeon]
MTAILTEQSFLDLSKIFLELISAEEFDKIHESWLLNSENFGATPKHKKDYAKISNPITEVDYYNLINRFLNTEFADQISVRDRENSRNWRKNYARFLRTDEKEIEELVKLARDDPFKVGHLELYIKPYPRENLRYPSQLDRIKIVFTEENDRVMSYKIQFPTNKPFYKFFNWNREPNFSRKEIYALWSP